MLLYVQILIARNNERRMREILAAKVPDWKVVLEEYGIVGHERQSAFLAQLHHESGGFSMICENLNYKADSLMKVWPSRYTRVLANQHAHHPELIANHVYSNRMGNGPPESGDGYKFRGRGYIQVTGKGAYLKFAKYKGFSLEKTICYLETPRGALESACWFWKLKDLNKVTDFKKLTRHINGGYLAYPVRYKLYEKYLAEKE